MSRVSEKNGLQINGENTECMVVAKKSESLFSLIQIEKELVGIVQQMQGLKLRQKKTTGIAKLASRKMAHLLTKGRLRKQTRKKAIRTYVRSTLLYGCEAWTLTR